MIVPNTNGLSEDDASSFPVVGVNEVVVSDEMEHTKTPGTTWASKLKVYIVDTYMF